MDKKKDWRDEVFHGLDEFGFEIDSEESKKAKKKKKKEKKGLIDEFFDIGV